MVREAIEAAQHAVDLRPREPRYRNNLAALLVEAGMPQEAFKQLREVYDEPVAHYDLGFLLNKRGMKAAALQEFTIALRLSPGMTLARQWMERLSRERGESSPAVTGTMSPPGQAPAGVAPGDSLRREEIPPPLAPPPRQYVAPPQYVAQPQYPSPLLPAQAQYPAQSPPPAQVQYSPPRQNAGPPQYQNSPSPSPLPAPPAANSLPLLASRDSLATGVRVIPPPPTDGNTLRRLPPVADPGNPADANREGQSPELVTPNPPEWRR